MRKQLLVFLVITQFFNQAQAGGKDYDIDRYHPPAEEKASAVLGKSSDKSSAAKKEKAPGGTSAPKDEDVLEGVFSEATKKLQMAQDLYDHQNFTEALGTSKGSLDFVRQKTGIHPKANYRNKFIISKDFFKTIKATDNFENLPLKNRDQVALLLQNEQNGYFLDLLNLMKRTNLIYIRAFVATLKQRGDLLARDISKVKQDILDVYAIPLYVSDKETQRLYAVFDFEVANSDQNYLFNRELYKFMLDNTELFGAADEQAVDAILKKHIDAVREKIKKDIIEAESLAPKYGNVTFSSEGVSSIDDYQNTKARIESVIDRFAKKSANLVLPDNFQIAVTDSRTYSSNCYGCGSLYYREATDVNRKIYISVTATDYEIERFFMSYFKD